MSKSRDPMDLLKEQNVDGMEWAKAFCQTLRDNPDIEIDEALMVGWFANPIMCMHDRQKSAADKLAEALEQMVLEQQDYEDLNHLGEMHSKIRARQALKEYRGEE